MLKFLASMCAEKFFNPQYTASAPAAIAAGKESFRPAGARIKGLLVVRACSFSVKIISIKIEPVINKNDFADHGKFMGSLKHNNIY